MGGAFGRMFQPQVRVSHPRAGRHQQGPSTPVIVRVCPPGSVVHSQRPCESEPQMLCVAACIGCHAGPLLRLSAEALVSLSLEL